MDGFIEARLSADQLDFSGGATPSGGSCPPCLQVFFEHSAVRLRGEKKDKLLSNRSALYKHCLDYRDMLVRQVPGFEPCVHLRIQLICDDEDDTDMLLITRSLLVEGQQTDASVSRVDDLAVIRVGGRSALKDLPHCCIILGKIPFDAIEIADKVLADQQRAISLRTNDGFPHDRHDRCVCYEFLEKPQSSYFPNLNMLRVCPLNSWMKDSQIVPGDAHPRTNEINNQKNNLKQRLKQALRPGGRTSHNPP